MAKPCRYSHAPDVDLILKKGIANLGAPWSWVGMLRYQRLRDRVVQLISEGESQLDFYSQQDLAVAVESAVDQVLNPYQNRLTLMAYGLLLGSVCVNAYLVTLVSDVPAMSAFVATLGGTLSGALGFQVLARLQAWAKQLSSNGGSLKTEQIPFNTHCLDIWRISQQVKNDLSRDGRNIRKDAWLQLNARFEKALTLSDADAYEALADALVDHRQTFGEVTLDFWLVREFHRNLKVRFCTPEATEAVKKSLRDTAPIHGLPLDQMERMVDQIFLGS